MILASYKIAYQSNALVYHSHNYSAIEEFNRYFDVGVFHRKENWIIKEFGKAEGEGRRYVGSGIAHLLKCRKYHLLPLFFLRNGMKLLGYKLGQHCEKLPLGIAKRFSMNRGWWDN